MFDNQVFLTYAYAKICHSRQQSPYYSCWVPKKKVTEHTPRKIKRSREGEYSFWVPLREATCMVCGQLGKKPSQSSSSQDTVWAKVSRLQCNCPISSCMQKGFSCIYPHPAGQKSKALCLLWICSSNSLELIFSPPIQFSGSLFRPDTTCQTDKGDWYLLNKDASGLLEPIESGLFSLLKKGMHHEQCFQSQCMNTLGSVLFWQVEQRGGSNFQINYLPN